MNSVRPSKTNMLFVMLSAGVILTSCGGKGSQEDMSSEAQPGDGAVLQAAAGLKLEVPDSNRGKIKLDVENIDHLKSVELKIAGIDAGKITKLPFEHYFDGTQIQANEVKVIATGINFSGEREVIEKTIVNVGSTSPGADPISDPNCFTNPAVDACLFYKNPVAQNRGPISPRVTYGSDLTAVHVFGVKLRNQTDPNRLRNSSIDVFSSAGQLAAPVGGKWNFPYKDDQGKHFVSQVMAFYWLNEQIEYMKTNSGAFYAENKNIRVNAFTTSVQNNAYWDGANIVMGNFGTQELALSSEVYLHEMGHANLDFATNGQINITSSFCATKFGCIGAIHEGMADAHGFIMFPNDPAMAQTPQNSINGWANRNPNNFLNRNLDYFFSTVSGGGEIHGMGTAYAVILWKIMKDPMMIQKDFEMMFSMHLPRLTSTSDFRTAKTIWMSLSDTRFSGKYTNLIKTHFESVGVL